MDPNDTISGFLLASTDGGNNLAAFFNSAFKIAISVGAILALLRIVLAGYLYMGSADMWSNKQHAKDVFRDAVVGLLLLLGIWLILHQINPCLLDTTVLENGSASGGCRGGNTLSPNGGINSPGQL